MIQSGLNDPALTPSPANPIVSLLQSGIRNPATTPNPIVSMIQSGIKSPTTYTKEPTSFALSNIDFGSTLVQSPKPIVNPIDPDSTPGEVRFCSSAAYTSWNGDEENAVCDSITTDLGSCRNLGAARRGKVGFCCSLSLSAVVEICSPRSLASLRCLTRLLRRRLLRHFHPAYTRPWNVRKDRGPVPDADIQAGRKRQTGQRAAVSAVRRRRLLRQRGMGQVAWCAEPSRSDRRWWWLGE
jgi:hypothetical protein